MKNAAALFAFLSILATFSFATASPIFFQRTEPYDYMGSNFLQVSLTGEKEGEAPAWSVVQKSLHASGAATAAKDASESGSSQTPPVDVTVDTFQVTVEEKTPGDTPSSDIEKPVNQEETEEATSEESGWEAEDSDWEAEDVAADDEEEVVVTEDEEATEGDTGDTPASGDEEKANSDEASEEKASSDEKSTDETNKNEKSSDETNKSETDKGEKSTDEKTKEVKKPVVGHPQAAGIVALVSKEVVGGLNRRNVGGNFARFQNYAGYKLRSTAQGGSEVTSLCRLKWYEMLYQNTLKTPVIAEAFTRELHTNLLDESKGVDQIIMTAAQKLDIEEQPVQASYEPVNSPEEAIEAVKTALVNAQTQYAAALSTLSKSEVEELNKRLYIVFTRNGQVGHTLSDRYSGRRLLYLILKSDRKKMVEGLRSIARLSDTKLLDQLTKLSDETRGELPKEIPGVTGSVIGWISTSAGNILIGGRGDNTYDLDQLGSVNIVIDLGGNDVYNEGSCNLARPVFVTIDLAGDDKYEASRPGTQGGSIFGLAMLLDREGNDTYRAQDVAQGSTLGGGAILIDYAGNDGFVGVRRVQGHAIGGIGLLINRGANDAYRAGIWAQGFGGPAGFGMIDDMEGKDHYFVGGLYYDSYEETPGYEGWGQGVGAGIRQVANGGIGVMLDGGGDDTYEYDYMAQGAGYWLGVGFARDFGGNDQRLGATRELFNGGRRYEQRFQRFSNGIGCHYALGFLFDDQGDDLYTGSIMGLGFAWDMAVGMLFDFDGNDTYTAGGSTTKGAAGQAGLGVLYDFAGGDTYNGYRGQGYAPSYIDYHDMPTCGGNFAFLIDYGSTDHYSCGARNNSYIQRGSSGGFLIDRPKESEVQQAAKSTVAVKEH